MFEFLAGVFTGYVLTWPTLIALFVFGTLFEYNEARGWAVFTAIVALLVSFFYFDVPLGTLAVYAAGYVAIGVVWSFWRYKRYVEVRADKIREMYNDPNKDQHLRRSFINDLRPTSNLDTITAWIVIWPFSFVESVAGDLINFIQNLVTKTFKAVYLKIYTSALGDLANDAPKE